MDEKEHELLSADQDEKIDQIDFSASWEEEPFSDGEKIEEIDFSNLPWEDAFPPEEESAPKVSLEKTEDSESDDEVIFIQQEVPDIAQERSKLSLKVCNKSDTNPPEEKSAQTETAESDDKINSPQQENYKPYQPEISSNGFDTKTPVQNQMLTVIILLLIIIFALITWFIILPMFRGDVNNIAEISSENSFVPAETIPTETTPAETERETLKMEMISPTETQPPTTEEIIPEVSYTVISGKATWEDAEEIAVAMGGHLASVHSEEEWYRVLQAVNEAKSSQPDLKYVWLGAVSEMNTTEMTVMFYWSDGSDNSWLMNANAHWYYDSRIGLSEPSGYDMHAYQKDGSLIREPYLMLWLPDNNITWSLNDEPDLTNYSNYKDSNMGFIVQTTIS